MDGRLPYFDIILEGRSRGEPASEALSRFVHWGYWEDPAGAPRTPEGLGAAMERLNGLLLDAAELRDGQALLDAGCGFGGTLAAVAAQRRDMRLIGLNIDARQLAVAAKTAAGSSWVQGDACVLPFASGSFDRALAVECIFHFPSRFAFLREAARVLKPGGMLALSDFVPNDPDGKASWLGQRLGEQIGRGYGVMGTGWPDGDYAVMARKAGLEVVLDRDITAHTLPTYPILLGLLKGTEGAQAVNLRRATKLLEWSSRLGLIRYRVLAFRR
ncbi:MAG: methyltransferase domain-containing protein [Elusimicrobia bacterium]|nr:methyltransferase domain-containing protein [Elusimicrobiota bacterium]